MSSKTNLNKTCRFARATAAEAQATGWLTSRCRLGFGSTTQDHGLSRWIILSAFCAAASLCAAAVADEAISRSFSVTNDLVLSEAISSAASVTNDPVLSEAISSSVTVSNDPVLSEAISRAVTVCDAGDLNEDGLFQLDDIDIFVAVLVGMDTVHIHVVGSDLNCDGLADGHDIQPFVDALLGL